MDLKYSSTSIMRNLSKELLFCGQYKINKGQIKPGAPCMTKDNKETLSMHCWRQGSFRQTNNSMNLSNNEI